MKYYLFNYSIVFIIIGVISVTPIFSNNNDSIISYNNVPLLLNNINSGKYIYLKDINSRQKLVVNYQVVVEFKYPICDTLKVPQVVSVNISQLLIKEISTKKVILKLNIANQAITDKLSAYEQYLWNLCSATLKYWYTEQPYETLIDRRMWQSPKVLLGGNFLIEP